MREQYVEPISPSLTEADIIDTDEMIHSQQFGAVRRRIFRQLIESAIYEGIIHPEIELDGARLAFSVHGADAHGQPVTYLCYGQRCFSFDRVRLDETPVLRIARDQAEAESLAQFLLETSGLHRAEPERMHRFIGELEQTLIKDAQAQYWWHHQDRLLHTCTYDELESNLIDGHPYHPSYKSRIGFNLHDNLSFGPEFSPTIHPIWLAAHRDWTCCSASQQLDLQSFLRHELGSAIYDGWMSQIRQRGYDPADYLLLPIHPWQWREIVVPQLHHDIRSGFLLPLGCSDEKYCPQQSIRTLANVTSPAKASLKHAINIVNTSTSRILAPHTVQNAPIISDWLHRIVQHDPLLREELRPVILREVLGIAYDRPQPDFLHPITYGSVSCIWRESLHPYLSAGEQAVPWTALCHLDRNGRPFIEPWVQSIGIEIWLRRLIHVSVVPIIHLLYAHGIALESHAQNMILIQSRGLPQRIALKDFHDGIRFAAAHLTAPEQQPKLHATPSRHVRINRNSYITTETPEEVRDFVLDAFFFINLSELALLLTRHFGVAEQHFWRIIHETLSAYQRRFPELQDRFELFDLYTPLIQVERLTNRRLFPETDVQVHRVRNPLALLAAMNNGK